VPSDQLKAMQHQLAAQELVIQQLRDHIADSADTTAIALRKAWQLGQTYWQQSDSDSYEWSLARNGCAESIRSMKT